MFPIRDHNPSERTPYVVWLLTAANVLVWFYGLAALPSDLAINRFYAEFALIPSQVSSGTGYSGLVTSMFLHGGLMHLAGNMLFLWIFGDNLEDQLGHTGFGLFYLLAGVGAGLAQVASDPGSPVPTVGASGAIAGVMGGYLMFFPKARVDVFIFFVVFFRILPIPAWLMLGLWLGLQIFGGIGADPLTGGVAYWAHAGGFILGVGLAIPIWLAKGGPAFWQRTEGHPDHPAATYPLQRTQVPRVTRRR